MKAMGLHLWRPWCRRSWEETTRVGAGHSLQRGRPDDSWDLQAKGTLKKL